MKLSVVIVNYNVKHYLWQCIDSVCRAAVDGGMEIWVVDNASSDDSIDYLRRDFPEGTKQRGDKHIEIHYIENSENVGFSKANNQAIRQSKGEFVLLLNPDTFVAEDALEKCVSFFETHDRAGAIGVHMINRNGSFARESRRGLPTPATSFYKVSGLCNRYPTHPRFAHYYMGHLPEFSEGKIEVISGAFMMLRRETLNEVGLLDEDYFMYGEDVDLSYRVGNGGWECWYVPALILHYKGESTQKTSFRYVQNFYNAMLIFFRKHLARRYWFSWFIVEVAVVAMGALSLFRSWYYGLTDWLNKLFAHKHLQEKNIPTLCWLGGDEAWECLLPICQRAGMDAYRTKSLQDVRPNTKFVAFEISEDGKPYASLLSQMLSYQKDGARTDIATFNLQNKTLILPNDILC